jgi:hypothetical protein
MNRPAQSNDRQTPRPAGENARAAQPGGFPTNLRDFQMRIARDGTWFYQGSPINRLPLVKLFSTVLRRQDDGTFWLTTPVENGQIEVEDAPFIAVELMVDGAGPDQVLRLRTNVDDIVPLDAEHPLRITEATDGEPRPYIMVRRGLEARLARTVFYELVTLAEPDPAAPDILGVRSAGRFFRLGRAHDA